MATESRTILVVDDSELNRMMMESFIDPLGHRVIHAADGRDALQQVKAVRPNLILLDVMMPEMDGFEVCRRIKSNPETRTIPIIIITALDKTEDNVKGIEAGADDFLTRPFDAVILAARMKSLLHAKDLNDEILKLEQLKEDLTRMIVHDLRTPLTSIRMSLQTLQERVTNDDAQELIQFASADVEQALLLINNLLDLGKLETHKMELHREDTAIVELLREAAQRLKPLASHHRLSIRVSASNEEIYAEIDRILIGRVISNLLSNAVKFADAKSEIIVEAAEHKDGRVEIVISNQGPDIPEDARQSIFEKFGQLSETKAKNNLGTGLGLTFCRLVTEAHKGRIVAVSPPEHYPHGAAFHVLLPVNAR